MPIRNVVTRGYGNGTYSPGVVFVVTRGYSIGEAVELKAGPIIVAALAARYYGPAALAARPWGPAALAGAGS